MRIDTLPKIALVTSVFNAQEFIDDLFQDVLAQTIFFSHCSWYLVDVTSNSSYERQIIHKYATQYPANIKHIVLASDPGIYGAWNHAICCADEPLITSINCDDRRAPYALEEQALYLASRPAVSLVYNDSYLAVDRVRRWHDRHGITFRYSFPQYSYRALLESHLPHNNPMWRRSLHDSHGLFDDSLKICGDRDFWYRCAQAGEKFGKHPYVLGIYYKNPSGLSTSEATQALRESEVRLLNARYNINRTIE